MSDHEHRILASGSITDAYAQAVTEGMISPLGKVRSSHRFDIELSVSSSLSRQLATRPSQEEEKRLVETLRQEACEILEYDMIRIVESSARIKSEESIKNKLRRRTHTNWPLADLYGARIIVDLNRYSLFRASNAIRSFYHMPYSTYPWGLESDGGPFRKISHETQEVLYEGRHLYVPFGYKGRQHLAEIQLMTPEQMEIAERSREAYEKRTGKIKYMHYLK